MIIQLLNDDNSEVCHVYSASYIHYEIEHPSAPVETCVEVRIWWHACHALPVFAAAEADAALISGCPIPLSELLVCVTS